MEKPTALCIISLIAMKEATLFLHALSRSRLLPCGLILTGTLLRLQHLLSNRSLWLDEAVLAVSINSRSVGEMLRGIEIFPEFSKPPLLFAVTEKIVTLLLGTGEMALRLVPFLSAVIALPLFYLFVKKYFTRLTALLALCLFMLADPLIYYAAEVKPYSTEVLIALVFLWVLEQSRRTPWSTKTLAALGLFPMVALWMSNSLVFLMAAAFLALVYEQTIQKRHNGFAWIAGITVLWGASFLLLYKISLSAMTSNQSLLKTFPGYLLDKPFFSLDALIWAGSMMISLLHEASGLTGLSIIFLIAGAWVIGKKDLPRALILIAPILITLVAAALGKYPFRGRLILFLVPATLIAVAEGVRMLSERTRQAQGIVFCAAGLLLILPMTITATQHIMETRAITENREVLGDLNDRFQQEDMIFLNTSAQPPFWYYASTLGYGKRFQTFLGIYDDRKQKGVRLAKFALDTVVSNGHECVPFRYEYHIFDTAGNFQKSLAPSSAPSFFVCTNARFPLSQQPKRAWFFLSAHDPNEQKIARIVKQALEASGRNTFSVEKKNTGLYLFEFTK